MPKSSGPTQIELNKFLNDVNTAVILNKTGGMPEIEVPRAIVDFYNAENPKGFDDLGYFIFKGVKVYEEGKKEAAQAKENITMEQKVFGNKF